MKDRGIIILVVTVVIALIVVLFLFLPRNRDHYSWRESYWQRSDQPYGTDLLSKILDSYFEDHAVTIVKDDIATALKNAEDHTNYVLVGWQPYLNDSLFEILTDFVYRGNDAFFAVQEIPEKLSTSIFMTGSKANAMDSAFYTTEYGDTIWYEVPIYEFDSSTYSYFLKDEMTMNFIDPAFKRKDSWKFSFREAEDTLQYEWRYIVPSYLDKLYDYDSLGSMQSDHFLNYIRIPYGKGFFYIHLNPIVFTNLYQADERNIEYTSKVFSYLKPGDILWDEASKTPGQNDQQNFQNEQEGPLKYILSQQSLRWSWYVILTGLVLFLIFRTKRMQKAIPVMEVNENKSLEFIQTIGRMYFISKNHRQMSQQKMKLFLHFINERYRIPASDINEEFVRKVHLKSEISESDIKQIFNHYRYIENTTDVTADDLILLHQQIDSFYKTCK